jgi:hypothetical protein
VPVKGLIEHKDGEGAEESKEPTHGDLEIISPIQRRHNQSVKSTAGGASVSSPVPLDLQIDLGCGGSGENLPWRIPRRRGIRGARRWEIISGSRGESLEAMLMLRSGSCAGAAAA